jgi:Leucine-rich repeat (LRR) protein
MSSLRRAQALLLLFVAGCGKNDTEPPPQVAVERPAASNSEKPAATKDEAKPKEAPKKQAAPLPLVSIDLRPYGLFAVIDAPPGARVERFRGKLVFIAGAEGADLVAGPVDIAKLKQQWTQTPLFKIKSLLIDEPNALLAEVEAGGRIKYLLRINVTIGGKDFHLEDYFKSEEMSADQARSAAAWARTLRQTPALKAAQEQSDSAREELKRLGAVFATDDSVLFPKAPRIDDKIFELLKNVPVIQAVAFRGAEQISAGGLGSLESLPKLRQLAIFGGGLNRDVIGAVCGLRALESLTLNGPAITDPMLLPLGNLTKLVSLDLSQTRLTDKGMVRLQGLVNLQTLTLDGANVSGPGLVNLKDCAALKTLSLADTALDDAGVKRLLDLANLTDVNLAETNVTAKGLELLCDHPKLLAINMRGTSVTAADLDKLKLAPPLKREQIAITEDQEPAPAAIAPPVPIEKLPPADPAALATKFAGKLTRDAEAEGQPIVGVEIHNAQLTDRDLGQLRDLKMLRKLNLDGCAGLTDAGLPYLANLTALQELDLGHTRVKGDGLVHLKGLKELTRLFLPPDTPLTTPQIQFLAALPALEIVTFTVTEPAYPKLRALSRMTALKELNLGGVLLSNHKMSLLASLSNLESLRLGNTGALGDRGLLALRALTKLKVLSVPDYAGSDDGLDVLHALTNLEAFSLYGPAVTDRGIAHLSGCDQLNSLALDRLRISDSGLAVLKDMDKLSALSLAETPITDRGLSTLGGIRHLEVLDLSFTKVSDAGLKNLNTLEELRTLILNGTAVTGAGCKALGELPELHRLALNDSPVDDAGMAGIARLTRLQVLQLGRSKVTAAGLKPLRPLRLLEDLNLAGCAGLTDEAIAVLKTFPALKRVSLRDGKVSAQALDELRKAGIEVDGR